MGLNLTVPYQVFSASEFKYYYDANYQLKQTIYPSGTPYSGVTESWTYDDIGNRTSNTSGGTTQNYTYQTINPNSNNWQRLLSDSVKNYSYDGNGSMTNDGTYLYSWDYENRMMGISGININYKYDYMGRRISKTVGGSSTTDYIYDGQNLIAESNASTADYVFGPGIDEPLAMYRNSTVYYYDVDGLGSVTLVNNTAGAVQNSYVHDSWGKLRASTVAVTNPFGYTAREFADAGLMYYRARYHNPNIGRFVSEDELVTASSKITGFWHSYSYVDNDPINWTDPSGFIKSSRKDVKKIECTDWLDNLECHIECQLIGKTFDRCWEVWIKKTIIEDDKHKKKWFRRDELECWCKDFTCGSEGECVVLDAIASLIETSMDLGLSGVPCGARGPVPIRR